MFNESNNDLIGLLGVACGGGAIVLGYNAYKNSPNRKKIINDVAEERLDKMTERQAAGEDIDDYEWRGVAMGLKVGEIGLVIKDYAPAVILAGAAIGCAYYLLMQEDATAEDDCPFCDALEESVEGSDG